MPSVAHDGDGRLDVLADLGRVDVDVDDALGLRREGRELAGDAVVEARPDGDQQVALVDGVVGGHGAVHAEHAERERMPAREAAQAHERRGDRRLEELGQGAQLVGGAGADHAAADVEHRPLGLEQRASGRPDLLDVALERRLVARQLGPVGPPVGDLGELGGDRDVDHDRAGTAGRGDVERLVDDLRDVGRPVHEVRVLDDRQGDAGDVGLLKGVGADQVVLDLAGDGDQRDGVEVGVGDAGHEVGGAGAARGQADADLAGGARVAVGGVHRALLVAHEHVTQLGSVVQRVVERDHHPAGKAEQGVAAFGFERSDDGLRALHLGLWRHRRTAPFSAPETSLTYRAR